MTPYLTRDELRALTGTPVRARQQRWLAANGWRFAVDAHGEIKVARAFHDRRMLGDARETPMPARVRPNLAAA